MREYFDGLKEINRDIKLKRKEKYQKFLAKVSDEFEVQLLSESAQHYRIFLANSKIDVWATTGKFTVLGSNKYQNGMLELIKALQ